MRIKIIHPGSPFHHHEGVVTRVMHNAHVDLNVLLDNGARIIVDAARTDYWTQKGEHSPEVANVISLKQAGALKELLGRLQRHADAAERPDEK